MKRRNFIQQLGCAGIALASERVYAFNSIGSSKAKKIQMIELRGSNAHL